MHFIISYRAYISNTDGLYLHSGTNLWQIIFGTLGMNFGGLVGVATGTVVEKTRNDHLVNDKIKKLSFVSYDLGYLVVIRLCIRGIEFGYGITNDKDYKCRRSKTH